MFTKGIGHSGGALVRIGFAIFLAVASVRLVLDVMKVQAGHEQLLLAALPTPQIPVPASTEWSNACGLQKTIVAGIGLGDAELLINPQTLVWPYAEELVAMQAQIAGVMTNEPLPETVLFSTSAEEQIVATVPFTTDVAYYFTTPLLPAAVVTSTIFFPVDNHLSAVPQPPSPQSGLPPKGSGPRGLVLYAQVAQPDLWRSVGRLTLTSVASQRDVVDSAEEIITFPPLAVETDLVVTAVYIDNDPDDRAVVVEAAAGSVLASVTETVPIAGDMLNITTLTLTAVPTGTSQLSLAIKSPPSPAGDSATLIGFNLNYRCQANGPSSGAVDLVIEQASASSVVSTNTAVSFTVRVTNSSLLTATNVMLTNSLQTNSALTTDSPASSCPVPDGMEICYLGDLPPGGTTVFSLWLTPTSTGIVTNTAVATSDQLDPTSPNIVTTTVLVTDYVHIFYVPIVLKPGSVAVTVTHSQNPAINNIPYSYDISVTNTGDRTIPSVIIQDDFIPELLVEQITPPAGCFGTVGPPNDLVVYCGNGLAVGETVTFSVQVRPQVIVPMTIEANIKVSSLEPGLYLSHKNQIAPTQINMCIDNPPGLANAYSPLLLGETYCGQTEPQKGSNYYFTFTLTEPGRVEATLRPGNVPWLTYNLAAATQVMFTTPTGTKPLAWCCSIRKSNVFTEYTYTDAGEKLLLVRSQETFGYTYTLSLEFFPSSNTNTAVFPSQAAQSLIETDKRLLGSISVVSETHTGWQTAVVFVGFISATFGLINRQRKRIHVHKS